MSAYRFEGDELVVRRWVVAGVLVVAAAAWPLAMAIPTSVGATSRADAMLTIWLIGAAPGLLIAALASLRARPVRVVAGLVLVQGMAMVVACGRGLRTPTQSASERAAMGRRVCLRRLLRASIVLFWLIRRRSEDEIARIKAESRELYGDADGRLNLEALAQPARRPSASPDA